MQKNDLSYLLSLPLFRKSISKSDNTFYPKKALTKFLVIFKTKRFGLSSQDRFLSGRRSSHFMPSLSLGFQMAEEKTEKLSTFVSIHQIYLQCAFFSVRD